MFFQCKAGLDFLLNGLFNSALKQRLTCQFLSQGDANHFCLVEETTLMVLQFITLLDINQFLYLVQQSYPNIACKYLALKYSLKWSYHLTGSLVS